jgi:hypothetical protein
VLGKLGVAYRKLGEPRRAIDYHGRRLVIARNMGDRRGEGIALFNMSLAFNDLRARARMLASAEAALPVFQSLEDPHADKVRTRLLRWRKNM